jgi:hypothetical protein
VERREEEEFLPPQPPGPEPELEPGPSPSPPPTATHGTWQGQQGYPPQQGWPAQGQGYGPPPGYAPPPAYPPPGYPPPPGTWLGQPAWGPPAPPVPDNGSAVAGFILSMVAGGLLVFSAGMSSIVSIVCAVLGIVYSRRGKRRVDAGETPKHRGLAQAGFVSGIIVLALSVIATLVWGALVVALIVDESFRDDFFDEDSGSGGELSWLLRGGVAAARGAAFLSGG